MTWIPAIIVVLMLAGMCVFGHDHGNHNRFK